MIHWLTHFAGGDSQIAARFPGIERDRFWVFGAYLLMLASLSGIAAAYTATVLLDAEGDLSPFAAFFYESLFGVAWFLIVWNTYRMMLLISLGGQSIRARQIFDLGTLIKLVMASVFGLCIALPAVMAFIQSSGEKESSRAVAAAVRLEVSSVDKRRLADLDELYLQRVHITDEKANHWNSLAGTDVVDIARLNQDISSLDKQIVALRSHIAADRQAEIVRSSKGNGLGDQLSRLFEAYQPMASIACFLFVLLYCAPIIIQAMGMMGVYEYAVEMQNIRAMAKHKIIPIELSTKYKGRKIQVAKYLEPEQLLAGTKSRLKTTDIWVEAELDRWKRAASDSGRSQ